MGAILTRPAEEELMEVREKRREGGWGGGGKKMEDVVTVLEPDVVLQN